MRFNWLTVTVKLFLRLQTTVKKNLRFPQPSFLCPDNGREIEQNLRNLRVPRSQGFLHDQQRLAVESLSPF